MKSWRTSASGVGMIFCGAGGLAAMLFGGQMPTPEQWTMLGGMVVAGFGLINAADNRNLPPGPPPAAPPPPPTPDGAA